MNATISVKTMSFVILIALVVLCGSSQAQTLDAELQGNFKLAQEKIKASDYKGAFSILSDISKKVDHIPTLMSLGDINKDHFKNYSAALTYYQKVQALIRTKLLLLDATTNQSEVANLEIIKDLCVFNERECMINGAKQRKPEETSEYGKSNEESVTADDKIVSEISSDDFLWDTEVPSNSIDDDDRSALGDADTKVVEFDPWGNPVTAENSGSSSSQIQIDAWGNPIEQTIDSQTKEAVEGDTPRQVELDAWGNPIGNESEPSMKPATNVAPSPAKDARKILVESNYSEENGIITIKSEGISFKFYDMGMVTSYTIFTRESLLGFRLPTSGELKTILKNAKENRDVFDLFNKFQWDNRNVVHFLTNETFIDTNREQKVKTYLFRKYNYEFEDNDVEWGEMASVILIRE